MIIAIFHTGRLMRGFTGKLGGFMQHNFFRPFLKVFGGWEHDYAHPVYLTSSDSTHGQENDLSQVLSSNLNFTGKLCVKLLRLPGHVGGLFTCRHKYDINAGGVTRRVTRGSVTPAPRDVVTFPLSKQDSLQSVLWGREYISAHQSWCEIFCWLVTLINISRAEIIPLFIIDIPRYPLISLARESRYNLESHHASPH